mmetsp:Transcript_38069/g.84784  ORF Transcript_38069/g.84784 Transcript_38069/m.84784 type:complete len:271 (+) Transcript_38069:100-912(+)
MIRARTSLLTSTLFRYHLADQVAGYVSTSEWILSSGSIFKAVKSHNQGARASALSSIAATSFSLQQNGLSHLQTSIFGRALASSAQQPSNNSKQQTGKEEKFDSLELTEEKINSITDKIPQRPVGVVEGTSYMLIIIAAFGVLAFVIWQFVANFILEPTAMQCFNHTLDRLKSDPRITVRLGSADDIRAWGNNSQSRIARAQIPHQIYKDHNGVEHVRIQFYMRGPGGTALANADMYRDSTGSWQYTYLLVDVYANNSQNPSRVHIVSPK